MFGKLLLSAQIASMGLCFLPLKWVLPSPLTLLFFMVATALALWVIWYNKIGNWSVLPSPKKEAALITTGPYYFMRHPMYLSVMFGCLAGVLHNQSLTAFFAWLTLLLILNVKSRYEERLLKMHFKEYEQYQKSVKTRFFPTVF